MTDAQPAIKKARHKVHVAHHTPGRVRMKIPTAKGDAKTLNKIAQSFLAVPGVEKVEVNPATGSLVVKYSAARPQQAMAPTIHGISVMGNRITFSMASTWRMQAPASRPPSSTVILGRATMSCGIRTEPTLNTTR